MNLHMIKANLADIFFPQVRCLGCDEPRDIEPGAALCPSCNKVLESLRVPQNACGHCLSPLRGGQPCGFCAKGRMQGLDQAFAPYIYKDLARKLIVSMKFGPVALAGQPLGHEMALAVSGIRFDGLVPVPLYKSRLRERGMNQALLLSGLVSGDTGIPVMELLVKTKKIKRQSSLPAQLREDNVKNAVACVGRAEGLNLLLVDDVRTTGATARECARALRASGAKGVSLLTAAIAITGDNHEA